MSTLEPRLAALEIFSSVMDGKQPLDQVLDETTVFENLETRDRAFVRMLVATVLRRMGQIDDLILRASEKKENPSPVLVHHILRLAVAQIAFMGVADYAAVDTGVQMADAAGQSRAKPFINAVLRRIAREADGWIAQQNPVQLNYPSWLRGMWKKDYGPDDFQAIAQASMGEASLDITLKNPAQANDYALLLDAEILLTGSLRRESAPVLNLPGFAKGEWWVQDASAAIPAKLFGDVTGKKILDMCAAPGGKTMQLASMGAHVTALDQSGKRLARLAENARRMGFEDRIETIVADAAAWQSPEKFSMILLDAPCSATGTIRRHPDLVHLKRDTDVPKLVAIQSKILDNAATLLAPGGVLVYCTCSLQKSEGEAQIDAFLARHPIMERQPVHEDEVGGLANLITAQGDVRILPFHLALDGGMDGFFISRLRFKG